MQTWNEYYKDKSLRIGDYLRSLAGHAAMFDLIFEYDPTRILEVGSGTGIMPIFLSWLGRDAWSIDNDPAVLKAASELSKALNGHCTIQLGDAFHLSKQFKAGMFDLVFSQGFFEHFSDEEIVSLVREQLAIAPTVIFSVPSKYYGQQDFGNERLMLLDDWRRILNMYTIKHISAYHPKIRSMRSIIRSLLLSPWSLAPWTQPEHILIAVTRR